MPYKDPEKARLNAIQRNRRWKKRHPEKVRELKRRQYRRNGAEQKRKWRAKNVERVRETFRRWADKNPAKRQKHAADYKKRHGQKLVERRLEWRKDHPERDRAACARWRAKHSEELRKHRKDRAAEFKRRPKKWGAHRLKQTHNLGAHRARQRNAIGSHTLKQWLARVGFYGWRCVYCGIPLVVGTLHKDHRIPVSKDGTEWPSNLVPSCRPCNSSKGNRITPRVLTNFLCVPSLRPGS